MRATFPAHHILFDLIALIILVQRTSYEASHYAKREEYRLKEFENRLMRIFGTKSEEVTGGQRTLYEELHNLYSLLIIIRTVTTQSV
jgi:hypothetical protein